MAKILVLDDFVGFQEVVRSIKDDTKLQYYIDRYEADYIYKLLGAVMGDAFLADIDANTRQPQTQKYKDIFDPFVKQNGRMIVQSKGMKDLLLSAVFYHYVTERSTVHTQAGAAKSQTESFVLSESTRFAERRFNDSLDTWDAIKWKIATDTNGNYPDYVFQRRPAPKYGSLL